MINLGEFVREESASSEAIRGPRLIWEVVRDRIVYDSLLENVEFVKQNDNGNVPEAAELSEVLKKR